MSTVKPITHVLLSGLDYERIEAGLRMYPGWKVCVIENAHPKPEHEELVKETDKNIRQILEKLGYREEDIKIWPVDFYNFSYALVSIYELLLREKEEGREVIINITSGTKPVSIAATLAAGLAQCSVVYFSAEKYVRKGNEIVSQGVIPEPILISPLFALAEIMLPQIPEKEKVILTLLKKEKAKNVTEIIREMDKEKGNKQISKKEIAKYTYYINALIRDKLINSTRDGFSLTELGKLVGMLLEKKKLVKKESF